MNGAKLNRRLLWADFRHCYTPLRITAGTPTVCVTCVARRRSRWVHKQKTQRFKHRIIPTCFKTPTQIVEVHIFLKVLFRNFTTNLRPTPTAPVWSVWQIQLCSHLPCVVIVRLFTAKGLKTLSKESLPPPTKPANYRVIYLFVRGFKWALVSQSSHIGEVRRSIWNGSFIAKHAIPLLDGGNKRNKN